MLKQISKIFFEFSYGVICVMFFALHIKLNKRQLQIRGHRTKKWIFVLKKNCPVVCIFVWACLGVSVKYEGHEFPTIFESVNILDCLGCVECNFDHV